jgi:hypothetical protein
LVGAWINGLAFIPFAHLQGQGRPDIVPKYYVVELLPFLLVLWLLTREFGIIGSAYAWVLRMPAHLIFLLVVMRFPTGRFLLLALPFAFVISAFAFVQCYRAAATEAVVVAIVFAVVAAALGLIFGQNLRDFVLSLGFRKRSQRVV